jgi:hypothetical protein
LFRRRGPVKQNFENLNNFNDLRRPLAWFCRSLACDSDADLDIGDPQGPARNPLSTQAEAQGFLTFRGRQSPPTADGNEPKPCARRLPNNRGQLFSEVARW